MNFGLIGLNFGRNYIKNLNELGQNIPYVVSRTANSYNNLNQRPRGMHYWMPDWKYPCESKYVETVIIATGNKHFEIARAALLNGKNVICEKPFVKNYEQALELKELAAKNNLKILVNYVHTFNPDYINLFKKNLGSKQGIVYSWASGRVKRNNMSFLQDYGSHDLSLIIDSFGYPIDIYESSNNEEGYEYTLKFNEVMAFIYFSFKEGKKRSLGFFENGDSCSAAYQDTGRYNPMKLMLKKFIKKPFTNIDLACDVTKLLGELEAL